MSASSPQTTVLASDDGVRRILLVQKFGGQSGAQMSLIQHLEQLDRCRFKPHVLVATQGWLTVRLDELQVPWLRLPFGHWNLLSVPRNLILIWRLVRYVRQHRIDLIHANEHWVAPPCYWAARISGIPVICHFRTGLEDLSARRARKYLYARFDRVLLVADILRQALARHVPDPKKLVTVRDGVELSAARPRFWRYRSRTLIVAVGAIRHIKGQLKILEDALPWLRANSRHYIIFVGATTDKEYGRQIEEFIRNHGLDDQVVRAGHRQDAARFFGIADALVAYSSIEGVPRVVMEAMLAGRPVIVSNTPGMNEVVRDGEVGRIVEINGTANSLARALDDLSANRAHWQAMGRRAHEIAASNYSKRAMSQAIQNIYDELLARSGRIHACASR